MHAYSIYNLSKGLRTPRDDKNYAHQKLDKRGL